MGCDILIFDVYRGSSVHDKVKPEARYIGRRKKKRMDKMESGTARKLTHILLIINVNAHLHVSLRLRLWMCYRKDSQRNMKPEREVSMPSYGTLYFCIIILI